jgi:hypothetical protein
MADTKISELPATTAPIPADIIPIVTDLSTTPVTKKVTVQNLLALVTQTGWISVSDSWAYASADNPTGVITVPSGAVSLYNTGDRIKLTQTGVKYFIVTGVTDTTLTVYGGTDYTLANAAISSIYYSHQKSPVGFPTNPLKWTQELKDSSVVNQVNPVAGTWYNLGAISLSIPIGSWNIYYQCLIYATRAAAGVLSQVVTLSNANTTESDVDLSNSMYLPSTVEIELTFTKSKTILLASKTTYYLNSKTKNADCTNIYFGGTQCTNIIRAICAYL